MQENPYFLYHVTITLKKQQQHKHPLRQNNPQQKLGSTNALSKIYNSWEKRKTSFFQPALELWKALASCIGKCFFNINPSNRNMLIT